MGRPKKKREELRIKFGISIDPKLFELLEKETMSRTKFIEKVLKEYYDKKNL
jgi:hypothetical protein